MHSTARIRTALAILALPALLAGCDEDAAQLAREIDAAREGCTQDSLRAGSEECVQMFERYAEIGTGAMQSYIGAVKALDQALQRLPAAQLDTAGLGHAVTPGLLAPQGAAAPAPSASRLPYDPRALDPAYPGRAPGYPDRDPRPGWDGRDGYDAYGRDGARRRAPEGGAWRDDPYGRDPYYDEPGYPGGGRWGGGYDGPYGPYGYDGYDGRGTRDPRGRGYDPDYDPRGEYDPRYGDPYEPYGDPGRASDPRYGRTAPPRGGLLPPEERLERPWLRERGDERYDTPERWRVRPPARETRAAPDSLARGATPPGSRGVRP